MSKATVSLNIWGEGKKAELTCWLSALAEILVYDSYNMEKKNIIFMPRPSRSVSEASCFTAFAAVRVHVSVSPKNLVNPI